MFKDKMKIYTGSISLISVLLIILNFEKLFKISDIKEILFFLILISISEMISIETTNFSSISFGFALYFTASILFPPFVAAFIVYIGVFLYIYEEDGKYKTIMNSSLYKRLFNASSYYITVLISSLFYNYIIQFEKIFVLNYGIISMLMTVTIYLFINSAIFMGLFALLTHISVKDMILKNIWALKSFFTLSPLGIMMLLFYSSYGWFGLILFFGPLFVARYSFKLYLNMKNIYLETIVALTKAIDAKDEYTKGHSVRVSEYSVMIGKEMKMSEPRLEILKTAALLHDVGKIGISDNILLKPGKLDDDEMQIIRSHPEMGAKIIDGIEFLDKARLFVSQHHERYDGKGYPFQIKGKDMPAESCIMAVADAFDAMTTDRSYRKGFSEERAMEILIEEKGKQFSPDVVEAMVAIKEKQGSVIIYVD